MDRWLSRAVALVFIGLAAYLTYRSMPARTPIVVREDGGAEAAVQTTALAMGPIDGGASEGGLLLADLNDLVLASDAGLAPDGAPLGLGVNAPRQIHLGVVLVTYQGAQGAPPHARAKAEARALAERLATDAKTDFHGAVQRGDSGSSDDVGRIPRGVLEPAAEVTIFSLAPGAVSDVVETPRGFWIAKRID